VAASDLTSTDAVTAALLRPLTDAEAQFVPALITDVSGQLRNRLRTIDARIAAYQADANDPTGVDPDVVAGVLARVIKRALVNPKGLWSTSDTAGPFGHSETYPGARGGGDAATILGAVVTAADVDQILTTGFVKAGTIRTRPNWLEDRRACP
jgi:hypothetical protein